MFIRPNLPSTFISISIGLFVLHFFGCLAICDAAVEAIGDGSLPVPSSLLDSIFNRYCDINGNMLRIYFIFNENNWVLQ